MTQYKHTKSDSDDVTIFVLSGGAASTVDRADENGRDGTSYVSPDGAKAHFSSGNYLLVR